MRLLMIEDMPWIHQDLSLHGYICFRYKDQEIQISSATNLFSHESQQITLHTVKLLDGYLFEGRAYTIASIIKEIHECKMQDLLHITIYKHLLHTNNIAITTKLSINTFICIISC